ncbi:SH3 domain-containing protein [Maribacter chungangensis]|uniref:SH3 domain-containing protein n=1 Tax=Maribacter chungangensis TaxID=1069117 RepID=A0ABW3B816_9FLAO
MHKILAILFLVTTVVIAKDPIYHDIYVDFKEGTSYALFGNDVKFRTAPDLNAEVLNLLKIGSEVEIVEKTNKTIAYNGIDSPFYKVKYKGKTGFVLGGLISLEKKTTDTATYLFAYKKEGFGYHLLVRSLYAPSVFKETSTALGPAGLTIALMGDMGLDGVTDILHIANHPEACGVIGGDIYFFETKHGLKKAIATTLFSEAGVNWYNEKLIFPAEEHGVANRIVYKVEKGEYGDEASNEIHISSTTRELRWENGQLLPKGTEQ